MPWRDIQVPWDSQPQEAVEYSRAALDRYGICGGWVASEPSMRLADAATGAAQVAISTGVRWRPALSRYGLVAEYEDPGLTRAMASITGQPDGRSFTYLARINLVNAPTAPGLVARTDAATSAVGAGNTIPFWRNGTAFDFRVNGTDYTAAGTWTLGQWYDIEIVGSASACVFYVDGAVVINGAAATAGAIEKWLHFGDVAGGGINAGDLQIVYSLFSRLSLDEGARASIRANPWQLFQPRTTSILTPAASTGLPTLSSATYVPGSLTATGFRPRVTATY